MAEDGHSPVVFRVKPELLAVLDGLADRRGLNRSAFLRQLLAEEALRLSKGAKERG